MAKRAVVYGLERVAAACSDAELLQNDEDLPTLRRLGVPEARLTILGNGIDLDTLRSGPNRPRTMSPPRAPSSARGSDDDVVVGAVGRLVREKGYPELFRAAAMLGARHPNVRVAVDRARRRRQVRRPRRRRTARTRIDAGVRFLGAPSRCRPALRGMDVLVLASHREGFPRAPMEAAAFGVPGRRDRHPRLPPGGRRRRHRTARAAARSRSAGGGDREARRPMPICGAGWARLVGPRRSPSSISSGASTSRPRRTSGCSRGRVATAHDRGAPGSSPGSGCRCRGRRGAARVADRRRLPRDPRATLPRTALPAHGESPAASLFVVDDAGRCGGLRRIGFRHGPLLQGIPPQGRHRGRRFRRRRARSAHRSRYGRRCGTAPAARITISRRRRCWRSPSRPRVPARGSAVVARRARAHRFPRTCHRRLRTSSPRSATNAALRMYERAGFRRYQPHRGARRHRARGARMALIVGLLVAIAVAVVASPLMARVATAPRSRRPTRSVEGARRPVPYLGGVAVFLAVGAVVAFERPSALVPLALALALGVADDVGDLPPKLRLAGEVAVGAAAAAVVRGRGPIAGASSRLRSCWCSSTRSTCSTASTGLPPEWQRPAPPASRSCSAARGGGRRRARRRPRRVPRVEPAAGAHLSRRRRELHGRHRACVAAAAAWASGVAVSTGVGALLFVAVPVADMTVAIVRRARARRPLFAGDRGHVYDQLVDRGRDPAHVSRSCASRRRWCSP